MANKYQMSQTRQRVNVLSEPMARNRSLKHLTWRLLIIPDHLRRATRVSSTGVRFADWLVKVFTVAGAAALAVLASGQQTTASLPELVVRTDSSSQSSQSSLIHRAVFNAVDNSLMVLSSQGNRVQAWTVTPDEGSATFGGSYLDVRAAQWIGNQDYLVTASPLQISIWDLKRQRKIKEIRTTNTDGIPLACHDDGVCAWEEPGGPSRSIRVQNVIGRSEPRDFQIGNDVALDLDVNPNGSLLAAAVNRPFIRIWSLSDGKELPPLKLQADPDSSPSAVVMTRLQKFIPKAFVIAASGAPTVVRFSPNRKVLIAANEKAIHIFNLDNPQEPILLRGHTGLITSLAFDAKGRIFSAGEDQTIRIWEPGASEQGRIIARLSRMPLALSVQPRGKVVAVSFSGGELELWNVEQQKLMATLTFLPNQKGWIAATPDGLFDTSEGAWQYASWRFRDQPGSLFPIELFYRNYYRPGLIADLIEGRPLILRSPIDRGALEVPKIKIEAVGTKPARAELIPGQGIRQTPEAIRFRIEALPGSERSAVVDLTLAHNGMVLRKWPGEIPLNHGMAAREVEVEMLPGENRITAFAFNRSGVRSNEAAWERKMQGYGYQSPQRTLYILDVGVGDYQNKRFNLKFAAADAALVEETFSIPEPQLQKMRSRLGEWLNKRTLELLESIRMEDMPAKVKITKIVNEGATRERILRAMREIVQSAGPNDAVLIFYSGHGISDGYHYYLLPFDMGLRSEPGETGSSEIRAAAATLISDQDIEDLLLPLNVANAALILDACRSGMALEGSMNRGPINSDGLARLAYEKGMYVLAASDAEQSAYEIPQLGHGALTYALFVEGIQQRKADAIPLDGRIEMREWLSYGARRVSSLVEEKTRDAAGTAQGRSQGIMQNARLVPRHIPETTALILFTDEKER